MEGSKNNMEKGDFGDTSLSISNLNNTGKPTLRTKVEILQNLTQSQSIKIEKLHEDVASTLQLLSDAADEMKVQDTTDHALKAKVEVLEDVLNDHQVAIEQQEKYAQVFDNRLVAVTTLIQTKGNAQEKKDKDTQEQLSRLQVENKQLRDEVKELRTMIMQLNQQVVRLNEEVM
jgi:chromosome segregation ATPase